MGGYSQEDPVGQAGRPVPGMGDMPHGNAQFIVAATGFHPCLAIMNVNFGITYRPAEVQDLVAVQGIKELTTISIDLQPGRATALHIEEPSEKKGDADGQNQNYGVQKTETYGQSKDKVPQARKKAKGTHLDREFWWIQLRAFSTCRRYSLGLTPLTLTNWPLNVVLPP